MPMPCPGVGPGASRAPDRWRANRLRHGSSARDNVTFDVDAGDPGARWGQNPDVGIPADQFRPIIRQLSSSLPRRVVRCRENRLPPGMTATRHANQPWLVLKGAAVAERLPCSPHTKANRVRSPAGSLSDFRVWELCRTMPLVYCFLGDFPFPPLFHTGAAIYSPQSPSSALKTSLLRAAQSSSLTHSWSSTGMQTRGKLEIPEKTRRPAASSGTIPTCKNPGASPSGIEQGLQLWMKPECTNNCGVQLVGKRNREISGSVLITLLVGRRRGVSGRRAIGGRKKRRSPCGLVLCWLRSARRLYEAMLDGGDVAGRGEETTLSSLRTDARQRRRQDTASNRSATNLPLAASRRLRPWAPPLPTTLLTPTFLRHPPPHRVDARENLCIGCSRLQEKKRFQTGVKSVGEELQTKLGKNICGVKCGAVLKLLAPNQGESDSTPGGVAPGFSYVGIVPDDASGRRVFSGISRFLSTCIPALPHTPLASPSSALKTSMSGAAQISPLPTSRGAIGWCATDLGCERLWVRIPGKTWVMI
ncbi:hypothetical protein PR048_006091 [Dryococelus australis]|uniref:Uncharacterized protein n=1 Tax=Dryococelus australis TaxID=614101 RepID=A0ABQ9IA04_9NEOP|nr:hypothetical protein PR048_006091 [Dryococelus australis]